MHLRAHTAATHLSLLREVPLAPSVRKPTKLSTSNKHIAPAKMRMRFALVKRNMVQGLHHTLLDALALRTGIFHARKGDRAHRTKEILFATPRVQSTKSAVLPI